MDEYLSATSIWMVLRRRLRRLLRLPSSSFVFRPLSSSPPHAINPSPCARLCTNAEELLCLIASVFVGQTKVVAKT